MRFVTGTDGKANCPSPSVPSHIHWFTFIYKSVLGLFPSYRCTFIARRAAALTYAHLICTHYLYLKFGQNTEGWGAGTSDYLWSFEKIRAGNSVSVLLNTSLALWFHESGFYRPFFMYRAVFLFCICFILLCRNSVFKRCSLCQVCFLGKRDSSSQWLEIKKIKCLLYPKMQIIMVFVDHYTTVSSN